MAEEPKRGNGHLINFGPSESRWAALDDQEYSEADGEEWSQRMCLLDSEEDNNVEQKLIRTSPQIDPLDVEALEIAESEKNQFEDLTIGKHIFLTLQILAVVFGDVGTSPLYTFDVIFNKYSLTGKDDVLGALSIVLYTLILISLVVAKGETLAPSAPRQSVPRTTRRR